MAIVQIEGLSFAYPPDQVRGEGSPLPRAAVLADVNLQVDEGAFCVVSGPTGCGKSTLLRLMKPEIAPRGVLSGSIAVDGVPLVVGGRCMPIDPCDSARMVGFVAQDCESQIVNDTVRAELAFALENLGVEPGDMRRRIADISGFLAIDGWMDRKAADLSGGQKQLVNLAAILAMRPRVLVLDEPTAQLDPSACRRFLDILAHVNRELKTTVIVSSHAPESLDSHATQAFSLGELPPVRPFDAAFRERPRRPQMAGDAEVVVDASELDFRYGRGGPWVVRDADMRIERGKIHALVGGNGCGKTTLIKVLAGICRPQHGRVKSPDGLRRALLPQDPMALFSCDSVGEELHEWHARFSYDAGDEMDMAACFGLDGFLSRHPYDLSGGQRQLLALAKLLLTRPDVLFLDEPTKGLDADAAALTVRKLRSIADAGAAVVTATHDTAFARVAADVVSLVFDGSIACTADAETFFAQSIVYPPDARSRLFGALS